MCVGLVKARFKFGSLTQHDGEAADDEDSLLLQSIQGILLQDIPKKDETASYGGFAMYGVTAGQGRNWLYARGTTSLQGQNIFYLSRLLSNVF